MVFICSFNLAFSEVSLSISFNTFRAIHISFSMTSLVISLPIFSIGLKFLLTLWSSLSIKVISPLSFVF